MEDSGPCLGCWRKPSRRRLKPFFLLRNCYHQDAVAQAGSLGGFTCQIPQTMFPCHIPSSPRGHQLPWDAAEPTLRPHKVALCPTPTQTSARWMGRVASKASVQPSGAGSPTRLRPQVLKNCLCGGRHPQCTQGLSHQAYTLSAHTGSQTPNPTFLGEQAQQNQRISGITTPSPFQSTHTHAHTCIGARLT